MCDFHSPLQKIPDWNQINLFSQNPEEKKDS